VNHGAAMKKLSELNFHNFFPSGKKTGDDKLHVCWRATAPFYSHGGRKAWSRIDDEQSGAGVLLGMFESTNAGFSSFPVRDTSVLRVNIFPLQDFLINETLHHVDRNVK
jgi:hypothetical protein